MGYRIGKAPQGDCRGSPRPSWGALLGYSQTNNDYPHKSVMSGDTIPASLFHRLEPQPARTITSLSATARDEEVMIINTIYLQQASKSELLDAIDQLIMEYAVADMCEIPPSKEADETQ